VKRNKTGDDKNAANAWERTKRRGEGKLKM
jgi:hypothetical protein